MRYSKTSIIMVIATMVAVTGCNSEEGQAPSAADPQAMAGQPAHILASMPQGAVGIIQAKKEAEPGETIVVRGRIGGRVDPISSESAVFLIVDHALPTCADNASDGCPTPWDYCCVPPERLMELSCTIQVVDPEGAPLRIDLKESELAPMDEVVVVGTVGPRPNRDVLIVKATGIHRVQP